MKILNTIKGTLKVLTALTLVNAVNADKLVIGVENLHYLPYYSSETGQYSGFAREVFDLFASKYNHEIEYKPLPVVRLGDALIEGKVDFKFPANPNWAPHLKKNIDITYSNKMVNFIDGVMVLPNKVGQLPKNKTIGIVRGFTPWALKGSIDSGDIEVSENSDADVLLKKVLAKRVDGAFLNINVARYTLKEMGKKDKLLFDESVGYKSDYYYLSTIKKGDVINQFNEFLTKYTDEVGALKKKYDII